MRTLLGVPDQFVHARRQAAVWVVLILFSLPAIAGAQTLEEKFAQLRARFAGAERAHPAVGRLRTVLDETRGALDEAARRIETGESLDGILTVVESRRRHLSRLDGEIEGAWRARERTAAAERFHADYRRQADALQAALQFGQKPTREAIANAVQLLAAAFGESAGVVMHSQESPPQTSLPPFRFAPIKHALSARAADNETPTPEDLAADSAVVLTPEIRTLAASLGNDPARIFAWVHNQIEFEPYFGAMQNSLAVLWSGRASDYDTATLLIALLRAAQIPARYVNGRITLSGPDLTAWMGAKDPDVALLMARQSFPLEINATGVALDHVWVEAYVAGGWVALDPSFKTHAFQPGIQLPYVPFARDAYLSSLKSRLASEAYLDQLRQYLQQSLPGAALSDLAYAGPIVPVPETLPAALPYKVTAVSRRVSALARSDMHRVEVQVSSTSSEVSYLTYEMYLPEVSLQSIVLSTVKQQLQLLLDDKPVAAGNAALPADLSMSVRVVHFHPLLPTGSAANPSTLRAAQSVAIGINALQPGPKFLGYLIDRLLQSNPASADPDQVKRATIYLTAIRYLHRLNEARQQTADALQLRFLVSRPEVVFTFHFPESPKLFDRPFVVTPVYAGIDVRIGALLVDLNGPDSTAPRHVDFRRVIGMTYSALEHQILEEIYLTPGTSAIKALQLAGELRIPILKLNAGNAADTIAGLPFPAEVKTRALAQLNQGRTNFVIPTRGVPFYGLVIYGFIAEDDQGNGVYADLIFNGGQGCSCSPPAPPAPGFTGTGRRTMGTVVSDPVNVSNGNLIQQQADLALSSRGPAVRLQRTYNSLMAAASGSFGFGWTHSYQMSLKDNQTSVTFLDGDGGGYKFTMQGNSYLSPPGLNLSLKKDAQGYAVRNPHGTQWRFDSKGALQTITDRNQNAVTLGYDPAGRLARVTDSLGRLVTFAYDGRNRIVSVQDFAGRRIAYTYDAAGNLASVTDAAGNTTRFTYYTDPALAHLLQTMTDPGGNVTSYEYYGDRKAARIRDASGRDARFFYLPLRNETVFIDARGFSASYFYNGLGNVTRIVKADGNSVDMTFTGDAKLAARTDENGFTTQLTYDAQGNLTSATDALGATVRLTYEPAFNQVTAFTDARGAVTRFEYDARGNLTRMVRTLGVEARFTYNTFGQLLTATDAEGNTASITYDSSANPIKLTDPLGNAAEFQFDPLRRLTRAIDSLGNAGSLEYDALDRLTRAVNPLNNAASASYDANGNLLQATDPNGGVSRYAYDALNNLSQVTDAQGNITSYGYKTPDCGSCSTGYDLVSFRDASGRSLAHDYDFDARMTQRTDPVGAVTGFAYSARGDLAGRTDPNGSTIRFEYDAAGRLIHKIFPDGTDARFTYDANGNLTAASNANTSIQFAYDQLNRVASIVDSRFGQGLQYAYNRNGQRTTVTDSEGGVTAYTYDGNSRLTSVTSPSGAIASFTYDAVNRRAGLTYSNSSSATYQYDASSRLTKLAYSGTLPQWAFTYDKNDNPTAIADNAGAHTYQYDELDRLTAATHPLTAAESYRYDGAGNRLASATDSGYTYDASGRLIAAEGVSYTYDSNGNLITRSDAKGATTYIYNVENQLTGINFPDGTSAGYKYDALGRRIEKSVGGAITAYLYDGVNILIEMDSAGVKLARYTHGPGIDEPLMMERGGSTYFYHADRIGSVAAVTDSSGNAACSYAYDSYGRTQPCQSIVSPFGFAGREYDAESGLVHMRARYYDSATGRFTGPDPRDLTGLLMIGQDVRTEATLMPVASSALAGGGNLGDPQQLSRYSYAAGNPLAFRDPSGLSNMVTIPANFDDLPTPGLDAWLGFNTTKVNNQLKQDFHSAVDPFAQVGWHYGRPGLVNAAKYGSGVFVASGAAKFVPGLTVPTTAATIVGTIGGFVAGVAGQLADDILPAAPPLIPKAPDQR